MPLPRTVQIGTLAIMAFPWALTASAQFPPPADRAQAVIDASPRHGEWVSIDCPGAPVRSWVMYPERSDKAPVVMLIDAQRELSDWIRAAADQLAADGYIAIAPELREDHSDRLRALDAVREYALRIPAASGRTAAMGFGEGGTASFEYAVARPVLGAAVVFYGDTPHESEGPPHRRAPVLALYAGNAGTARKSIERATSLAARLGMMFEYEIYDGASPDFLRERNDAASEAAAEMAWARTLEFLRTHLH